MPDAFTQPSNVQKSYAGHNQRIHRSAVIATTTCIVLLCDVLTGQTLKLLCTRGAQVGYKTVLTSTRRYQESMRRQEHRRGY